MAACLALLSACGGLLFCEPRLLLYYGDAEAHLNIARRVVDSQTPGYDQLGTVWLPLPHVLMLPFVRRDAWWRSGLAGAIPSALCFVAAGLFLFAAVRRVFRSHAAAVAATALLALNPNQLYLQSIPMTEPVFLACLMALLYFTVRFRETQGRVWLVLAGSAACAGTLTRYEGWFLLPFVALWLLAIAKRGAGARLAVFRHRRWLGRSTALPTTGISRAMPWISIRGPYSARAIQGSTFYPGKGDWRLAWLYYRTAARLVRRAGPGSGGRRGRRGRAGQARLLADPAAGPAGRVLRLEHSFRGHAHLHARDVAALLLQHPLWPGRAAAAGGGRGRPGGAGAALAPAGGAAGGGGRQHALVSPPPAFELDHLGGIARQFRGAPRVDRRAAAYLAPRYRPGAGILTSFGDLTGVYRAAGIPLRETFTGDNGLPWLAAVRRPELFVWQEWAVAKAGDAVDAALAPEHCGGLFRLEKSIEVKSAPAIHIYRRAGGMHGTS